MWRTTLRVVGIRYGGNSMTKGASSLRKKTRLNRMEERIAIRMPNT